MMYLGDFAAGATVYCKFATNAAAGSRVDFNNALEAADVRVYKDGGTAERSSTAGFTVTSGFDSMVGVHHIAIDLSDNTDAGFYAAGHEYQIVLYPDETVDSLNVAAVIAHFSIANRCVNWAAVAAPTTTVGLTGTTIATSQVVASVSGAVGSVTGAVGSVTGAVGSVAAGGITASSIAADAIGASELAADAATEIANAVKAAVVEAAGSYTIQQALSIILSAVAGVTADNGATLKTPDGTATRIAATLSATERTAITLTPSA